MLLKTILLRTIPTIKLIRNSSTAVKSKSSVNIEEFIRFRKMEAQVTSRVNPIVMKLDSPEFHSIFNQNLNDLVDLFKKYNYEIRIAGGAVRDLLLGKTPTDIDFATTATPTQMKDMFTAEDIRMVNMNGEKHGTITPRINNAENFEVTTLRIDVTTDGRHAEVHFTTDWQLDANRRDLTINSMFLGFDGSVYDYFYGWDDLKKRRVAFVGDTDTRIKEDYLRILRYFRFYGRISNESKNHESETLDAIKSNIAGLERISGERIWSELKKILQGRYACDLIITLLGCNATKYIGLPEEPNTNEFIRVCEASANFEESLNPISLLSGLLGDTNEVLALHKRLKLTAFERDLALFLVQNRIQSKDINDIFIYQMMCFKSKLAKRNVLELLKYHNKQDLYNELVAWEIPPFPINGTLLLSHGCPSGKALGIVSDELKQIWCDSKFKMDANLLLEHLPKILEGVKSNNCSPVKKIKMN